MGCVGVVALSGRLIFVMAPDPEPAGSAVSGGDVVVIDPGHGGLDEGARSAALKEKEVALDVALRMEACLQREGVTVVLTRRTDVRMRLRERLAIADGFEYPIFVSIHFNQSPFRSASGVEIFYAPRNGSEWMWAGFFNAPESQVNVESRELAGFLGTSLEARTQASHRGIQRRALFLVQHARGPAVLVEGGFLSHPQERQRLGRPEYRQVLAEALAEGVVEYTRRRGRAAPATAATQTNP
jgi:N-acetylmuramoyl-L-alanine amidase